MNNNLQDIIELPTLWKEKISKNIEKQKKEIYMIIFYW